MSIRFVTGRLSADLEVQSADRISITKFTVLEKTHEHRGDQLVEIANARKLLDGQPGEDRASQRRPIKNVKLRIARPRSDCVSDDALGR